jgi:ribosome-binding factor A
MRELTERQLKVNQELKKIAQNFFQRESSGSSLITVTNVEVSADLKNATVYITALPQSKEAAVLDFAKRMRGDLRTDIKKHLPIRVIPFVEVEIDNGEHNRQKIDSILFAETHKDIIKPRTQDDINEDRLESEMD